MQESSIVLSNMLEDHTYRPYCSQFRCGLTRMRWTGSQMKCPKCREETSFDKEFIKEYRTKHNLKSGTHHV